ncbi:hypothetical protein R3P38DRAFT_2851233 [Favolaschia claudopus]|uniref:F-box domain-containing protein n=1 Tax=Favolaschia claudopus TaxID=2862362 RepID=A0AAW0DLD8_9AGAR
MNSDTALVSVGFSSSSLPNSIEIENFRNLIRSGAPPPDPEALRATILVTAAELEQYDLRITEMQKELDRLISERKTLSSHLDKCRSVLSTLYTLPDELLAEIFDQCFPEDLYDISGISTAQDELDRVSHRHVLKLAHVCSRWYRVATNTPKLWSTIAVDADCWPKCRVPKSTLFALIESSLERGRNHPLTLKIRASRFYNGAERSLELFLKHAHRWFDVEILSVNPPPQCLLAETPRLDRLKRLYFDSPPGGHSWKDTHIFQDAPHLTELEFHAPPSALPKLPWSQIQTCTQLWSSSDDPHLNLEVLRHASRTSTYRFVLDLRNGPNEPWNSDISSEVQSLHIWFSTVELRTTGFFFDSLTLPCLQGLSLCLPRPGYMPFPPWAENNFLALAERSQFCDTLSNLTIHAMLVTDTELLRCLGVLPRLTYLDIADCILDDDTPAPHPPLITDKLLLALVYVSDGPMLIPRLQYLRLVTTFGFSESSYRNLVVSRVKKIHDIDGDGPFEANLFWRAAHHKISLALRTEFAVLQYRTMLVFVSGWLN